MSQGSLTGKGGTGRLDDYVQFNTHAATTGYHAFQPVTTARPQLRASSSRPPLPQSAPPVLTKRPTKSKRVPPPPQTEPDLPPVPRPRPSTRAPHTQKAQIAAFVPEPVNYETVARPEEDYDYFETKKSSSNTAPQENYDYFEWKRGEPECNKYEISREDTEAELKQAPLGSFILRKANAPNFTKLSAIINNGVIIHVIVKTTPDQGCEVNSRLYKRARNLKDVLKILSQDEFTPWKGSALVLAHPKYPI
eukprot:m.117098 g.117098  ORF g.117098 m.117098 type:complete len:250 (+) comp28554_c0_seq2:192-941(+)